MRRQGSGEPPISLFSFQDIITSLTGVLFLVMILLALFLCETRLSSPDREAAAAARQRTQELAAELSAARQRLAELLQQLEKLGGSPKLKMVEEINRLRDAEKQLAQEALEASAKVQEAVRRLEERQLRLRKEEARTRSLQQQLERTRARLRELEKIRQAARRKIELAETVQRFQLAAADQATPVFLLLKENEAELTDPGSGEKRTFSRSGDPDFSALQNDLFARLTPGRYLLFLVQPGAFLYFSKLLTDCQNSGLKDYGAEVLPSDKISLQIVTEAAP